MIVFDSWLACSIALYVLAASLIGALCVAWWMLNPEWRRGGMTHVTPVASRVLHDASAPPAVGFWFVLWFLITRGA